MSQRIPIYIPTYINNAEYSPSRVLPRLLFYNGMVECEKYYIQQYVAGYGGISQQQFEFPYFDNYNVVSGSFPTTDSRSLLFNNEAAVYGQIPTQNLYTEYWEKYISFLYNPTTRVLNCQAIIPLADYFHMELNDIVNFRGNYWHLRAINDYSLKTGECTLQLIGPLIYDVFDAATTNTPTTTTTTTSTTTTTTSTTTTSTTTTTTTTTAPPTGSATLAWSYSETGGANGTMDLYVNGFAVESRSSTASGTRTVYVGDTIYVQLQIVTPCGSPDTYANVYTTGNILNDANCANNAGVSLTTGTYTVVSGDIGNTLTLNTFAQCDSGCV